MIKLVSMLGNWLMDRFIKEKMPNMAMATKINAVVTGLLTAVLCRLMLHLFYGNIDPVLQTDLSFGDDAVAFLDA